MDKIKLTNLTIKFKFLLQYTQLDHELDKGNFRFHVTKCLASNFGHKSVIQIGQFKENSLFCNTCLIEIGFCSSSPAFNDATNML